MTQSPPPSSPEPPPQGAGRIGALPVLGCVAALLALLVVFGTAVGGSFQSLAILGGVVVLAGVGVAVFLARQNRRG